ncbi:MAG: ATP-binding cassette domain-containing protein [Clostridiales bacterium]
MSIEIKNLTFTYQEKTIFQRDALKNINLKIDDGEFVGILGASGSGKSTLMQHINGVIPSKNAVRVNGVSLGDKGVGSLDIAALVGLAFQYPEHQIFCDTVGEELAFGCHNLGFDEKKTHKLTYEYLNKVGLDESYLLRSPFELSGGEKRRVVLASIFAMDTPILLLDEPTVGLDIRGKRELTSVIKNLNSVEAKTILWVGHDLAEIITCVKRLIVLSQGEIVLDGKVEDVLKEEALLANCGITLPQKSSLVEDLEEKFNLSSKGAEGEAVLRFFINGFSKDGAK